MAFAQQLELAARLAERRLAALLDETASAGAPERLVAAMRHAARDIETARRRLAALADEAMTALAPFGRQADALREAAAFTVQGER